MSEMIGFPAIFPYRTQQIVSVLLLSLFRWQGQAGNIDFTSAVLLYRPTCYACHSLECGPDRPKFDLRY